MPLFSYWHRVPKMLLEQDSKNICYENLWIIRWNLSLVIMHIVVFLYFTNFFNLLYVCGLVYIISYFEFIILVTFPFLWMFVQCLLFLGYFKLLFQQLRMCSFLKIRKVLVLGDLSILHQMWLFTLLYYFIFTVLKNILKLK